VIDPLCIDSSGMLALHHFLLFYNASILCLHRPDRYKCDELHSRFLSSKWICPSGAGNCCW